MSRPHTGTFCLVDLPLAKRVHHSPALRVIASKAKQSAHVEIRLSAARRSVRRVASASNPRTWKSDLLRATRTDCFASLAMTVHFKKEWFAPLTGYAAEIVFSSMRFATGRNDVS
jgi:hypothetical protein